MKRNSRASLSVPVFRASVSRRSYDLRGGAEWQSERSTTRKRRAAKYAAVAYLISFVTVVLVNFGIFARLLLGITWRPKGQGTPRGQRTQREIEHDAAVIDDLG